MKTKMILPALGLMLLTALPSCKEKIDTHGDGLPSVARTREATPGYTYFTAQGQITRIPEGLSLPELKYGILLSTQDNPTPETATFIAATKSADTEGGFSVKALRLLPETTYYYRAIVKLSDDNAEVGVVESVRTRALNTADGHPYIDIGLSVDWGWYDYGADKIGGYQAYDVNKTITLLGTKWGNGWRSPGMAEFNELINKTTHTTTTEFSDSPGGVWFTGPNDESVYFGIINLLDETGDWGYFSSEWYDEPKFVKGLLVNGNAKQEYKNVRTDNGINHGPCRPVHVHN